MLDAASALLRLEYNFFNPIFLLLDYWLSFEVFYFNFIHPTFFQSFLYEGENYHFKVPRNLTRSSSPSSFRILTMAFNCWDLFFNRLIYTCVLWVRGLIPIVLIWFYLFFLFDTIFSIIILKETRPVKWAQLFIISILWRIISASSDLIMSLLPIILFSPKTFFETSLYWHSNTSFHKRSEALSPSLCNYSERDCFGILSFRENI